ncbi:MAG: DUF3052 domain-containing protein [Actinomycetaceae bacterium]|nr:DUF3052 domain-containing protein [Actinomycetaceae bacterium]
MSGSVSADAYGFSKGAIIQEFGYDEDVDFEFRQSIENATGEFLEDEDYRGAADAVLAWWRSDDGDVDDLADYLVDCTASLDEGASEIWLVVPGHQSDYRVSTIEIEEASQTAGLSVTRAHGLESGWTAYRITTRRTF